MQKPKTQNNYFISYSHKDAEIVKWIECFIREGLGCSTYFDERFRKDTTFTNEINESLENSKSLIAIISPDYFKSSFCRAELDSFFVLAAKDKERSIFMFKIKDCEVPALYGPQNRVELAGISNEDEVKRLITQALNLSCPLDPAEPLFPKFISKEPVFPIESNLIRRYQYDRNPNFTGRVDYINKIKKMLDSGKAAAVTQTIHGLGGIGKTQIANEFAHCYANNYSIVWWLTCEQITTVPDQLQDLGISLNIGIKSDIDPKDNARRVLNFLETVTDTLLVYDNVNTQDEVREWLPKGESCHVIITSRNRKWPHLIKVDKWRRAESVKYIIHRTGQTDKIAIDNLADALDDFPLGLAQAASYIKDCEKPVSDYVALYKVRKLEVLERIGVVDQYHATVATTWDISFKALEKESESGAALLKLFSFLAPDAIPLQIIRDGGDLVPESIRNALDDELKFDDAIKAMLRFGLVEKDDDKITIHRLVQEVSRNRIDDGEKLKWIEAAVGIVNTAYPYECQDVRTWDTCSNLHNHALIAAEFAEKASIAPEGTGNLLGQVAVYLQGRAEYEQAMDLSMRSLEIGLRTLDPDDPEIANRHNNLGNLLRIIGDLEGAKKYIECSLKINEKLYGSERQEVAQNLINLGLILRDLGDLECAKKKMARALEINEKINGPEHPLLAANLCGLGCVLADLGDLEGAKKNLERALIIDEKVFSKDHPEPAIILNHLAGIQYEIGDIAGAKSNMKRAYKIFKKFLGDDHPRTKGSKEFLDNINHIN